MHSVNQSLRGSLGHTHTRHFVLSFTAVFGKTGGLGLGGGLGAGLGGGAGGGTGMFASQAGATPGGLFSGMLLLFV